MNTTRRSVLASCLMFAAAASAVAMRPRLRRSDVLGPLDLAGSIPRTFGDWAEDKNIPTMIVDPQTQATIDETYTQTLSRIYVNSTGQRMMLSLAYGAELSDTGVGLHYPEVCYPAQGFRVNSSTPVLLQMSHGVIKARRLETSYGDQRFEPVTYWTMIGPHTEFAGIERKWAEVKLGLQGERPDGLLFRISSIQRDSKVAFELQQRFAETLVSALTPKARARLAGLT